MRLVIAAPLLAFGLFASLTGTAFAQCAMPAPEPKTSALPVEQIVQPG
jgi:hypothetical protein